MQTIKLPKEIEVVVVPQETVKLSTLTIERTVDLSAEKKVKVFIQELRQPITLWEGEEYDKIGQWTDVDVKDKLLSLLVS